MLNKIKNMTVSKSKTSNKDKSGLNFDVLVVDDNFINQKLMKTALEKLKCSVTLASDGNEAVEARKNRSFSLIFMDIQMPIKDGIEATKEILDYEKESGIEHIPIVALTGNVLKEDKEKYLNIGMDDYMSKPISLNKLEILVKKYAQKVEQVEVELHEDSLQDKILLLKDTKLSGEIYASIFNKLDYKVDTAISPEHFLDSIEDNRYKFIVFDSYLFEGSAHLVLDMAKDSSAIPFVFTRSDNSELNCKTISSSPNLNEIGSQLEKA
jgi:CheY-like chemotaxis protein